MKFTTQLFTVVSIALIATGMLSCKDHLMGDEGKHDEDVYLNYETISDLRLPFDEEWHMTVAGKDHLHGGHHFITRGSGQRYAFDAVIYENGNFFSGDGSKNEDHYCFGKNLFAPAGGVIIEMENSIADNTVVGVEPEGLGESTAAGNYIMIDHLNGEVSLMAHFKQGTIIVNVGDTVVQGQEVGKAGNSGNSTAPHLHYHIQNGPGLLDGFGLPAMFNNYYADGVLVERGIPVQGQLVKN